MRYDRLTTLLRAALAAALVAPTAPAEAQDIRLSGQVRPRFEYRDPLFTASGSDDFVSMRSRLGLAASLSDDIALFVQLQDVRFWGEDRTISLAPGVTELHQGYIAIARIAHRGFAARIGRQEIVLGSERLVGNLDWAPRARSFDGVRATLGSNDRRSLDLFATVLSDRTAGRATDALFNGAWATLRLAHGVSADIFALHNYARPTPTDQATVGARIARLRPAWAAELEAAFQFGQRLDRDVSAWMLRASAGPAWAGGRSRLLLSFEHYSGGDPEDDVVRVFDTLFGTGHRFLGFADVFTDIPAHTAGRGVQDFAIRSSFTPDPALQLILDLHAFRAASSAGLPSARFGEELDLRAIWRWRDPLQLVGGASLVRQGPALAAIGRLGRDMTWLYVMLNAAF